MREAYKACDAIITGIKSNREKFKIVLTKHNELEMRHQSREEEERGLFKNLHAPNLPNEYVGLLGKEDKDDEYEEQD